MRLRKTIWVRGAFPGKSGVISPCRNCYSPFTTCGVCQKLLDCARAKTAMPSELTMELRRGRPDAFNVDFNQGGRAVDLRGQPLSCHNTAKQYDVTLA
jgi:hypothetical protein